MTNIRTVLQKKNLTFRIQVQELPGRPLKITEFQKSSHVNDTYCYPVFLSALFHMQSSEEQGAP